MSAKASKDKNLTSKAHGHSVQIILASSEAHSLAVKTKVKFAPAIFKKVDFRTQKILFG